MRQAAQLIFPSIMRQKSLRIGFAVGTILLGRRTAFGQNGYSQPTVESTLCIDVHNTADVSSGVLGHAAKQAAAILLAAGIPTLWHRAFPDSLVGRTSHPSSPSVAPTVKPVDERGCLVLCVVRGMPRGAFPQRSDPHFRTPRAAPTSRSSMIGSSTRMVGSICRCDGFTNSCVCHGA